MAEKHEHSKLQVLTKPYIFKTDHTLLGDKVSPEKGTSISVQEFKGLQFLLYVMAHFATGKNEFRKKCTNFLKACSPISPWSNVVLIFAPCDS